jgi:hypothetical protein
MISISSLLPVPSAGILSNIKNTSADDSQGKDLMSVPTGGLQKSRSSVERMFQNN